MFCFKLFCSRWPLPPSTKAKLLLWKHLTHPCICRSHTPLAKPHTPGRGKTGGIRMYPNILTAEPPDEGFHIVPNTHEKPRTTTAIRKTRWHATVFVVLGGSFPQALAWGVIRPILDLNHGSDLTGDDRLFCNILWYLFFGFCRNTIAFYLSYRRMGFTKSCGPEVSGYHVLARQPQKPIVPSFWLPLS